jgi:hypothetical protein
MKKTFVSQMIEVFTVTCLFALVFTLTPKAEASRSFVDTLQLSCLEHVHTIRSSNAALSTCYNVSNYDAYISMVRLVDYVKNGGKVDYPIILGVSKIRSQGQAKCLASFLKKNAHFYGPTLSQTCQIRIK